MEIIEKEKKVLRHLVESLIKAEMRLSVHDGEDWAITSSRDADAIMAALFSVDEERIYVQFPHKDVPTGWISIVHGNDGWDAIHDYTMNLAPYLTSTEEAVELWEAEES